MRMRASTLSVVTSALAAWAMASSGVEAAPVVRFTIEGMGAFDIQLFDTAMPRSTTNFLSYVNANKYNGTVIHRNSDTSDTAGGPLRDFVIQGGGFSLIDNQPVLSQQNVVTTAAIADEPGGGVAGPSNLRGTIAMAKSGPNTVTSQWFINQGNNSFLDSPTRSDGGFSAFGMVLGNGMTVVDAIGDLPLPPDFGFSLSAPFNDLPLRNFSGNSIDDIEVPNTVRVTSVKVLNLKAGDFDRNGIVNAADHAIWKANYGLASGAFLDKGDADMDGDVDGADFTLWQRNLGMTSTPVTSVPEPGAAALGAMGCSLGAMARRRRRPTSHLAPGQ